MNSTILKKGQKIALDEAQKCPEPSEYLEWQKASKEWLAVLNEPEADWPIDPGSCPPPIPKVGAAAFDANGNFIASSYRAEDGEGEHAELILLKKGGGVGKKRRGGDGVHNVGIL